MLFRGIPIEINSITKKDGGISKVCWVVIQKEGKKYTLKCMKDTADSFSNHLHEPHVFDLDLNPDQSANGYQFKASVIINDAKLDKKKIEENYEAELTKLKAEKDSSTDSSNEDDLPF